MNTRLLRIGVFVFVMVGIALAWLNRNQLTAGGIKAWVERSGIVR
jgi:hypothetical protein